MTAIPSEIVDKHLKLASGTQLKVILAFLRNSQSEDAVELIMKKLGLSETEVLEALEYWAGCHVLIDNEHEQPQPIQTEKAPVKQIEVTAKPTREEAIRRMSESTELQFLFSEVQNRLGRLITQAEMATLVWLHDHQGLPVPVILMSIEYAMNQEKVSFSYIEKTCIDWANNGSMLCFYLKQPGKSLRVCLAYRIGSRRPERKNMRILGSINMLFKKIC